MFIYNLYSPFAVTVIARCFYGGISLSPSCAIILLPDVTDPPPQVRRREGSAAEEVKEEPDDTALRPTEAERSSVEIIRKHGVPTDDAVLCLRQNGHNLSAALEQAIETVSNRTNCQMEDRARLESEKEKEKVAAQRREEDMTLSVLGDIEPRFREVRCAWMKMLRWKTYDNSLDGNLVQPCESAPFR